MANTNGTAVAYGEITILDLLDDATYIYYANDDKGSGASLSPTEKSYIGIYSGSALSTGQPAPDTQEYTDIKDQINWSKYVGNGITKTEIRYQNGKSSTEYPEGDWLENVPAAESGKYLWTRTTLTYTDGTTSVSYSVGAHGEDGQDGDKYLIETSHERVLKFKTKQGMEFSPVTLGFSVYELTEDEPIAITFKTNSEEDSQRKASFKIQILASNGTFYNVPNDYDHQNPLAETGQDMTEKFPSFLLANFYNFLVEQTSISTTALGEDLTKDAYLSVLTALESTSTYIRFVYLENGVEKAFKPVEIANGVSDDMAEFNITATEINAAVQDRVMSFDANGLHILNGGFDIKTENYKIAQFEEAKGFSEGVEYYEYDLEKAEYNLTADETRDTTKTYYIKNQDLLLGYLGEGLYVKGNGIFTGEVYANSGSFNGKVTASDGEIGGFVIGQNALTSKDNGLILQGGDNSKIFVNSIELGSGAIVKDYIQLGDGIKLYGNSESPNVFEIESLNGEISTPLLAITRQGTLILGDDLEYLALDGKTRTISTSNYSSSGGGKGWYLSEDKSYFNNVVVRGKLEAAVFETGKVSAVGGILLIRPSTKIASIETVDGKSIIELEDETGFAGANDEDGAEYYYLVAASGETTYCYTVEAITNKKIILTSEIGNEYTNATIVNYGRAGSIGLGINGSTNDSAIPSSSFSVFEWAPELKEIDGVTTVVAGKNYPIVLGKLPDDNIKYKDFAGKYGLYAENVLLKGALVAETAGTQKVYSGISTADQDSPPLSNAALFKNFQSEILLWAGAQGTDKNSVEKSNFYVDRNGNLYANSGYFSGTIITNADITASSLTAAHIYGSEDELALTIQDDKGTEFLTSKGALIMSVDSSGVKIADGMNFIIGGSTFSSSKLGTSSLLISNPEKTDASVKISLPNTNETSKKGKISFSNSLTAKQDDQAVEDYAILEENGLKFQANGENILDITGNNFSVNKDIYLAKDIYYGENIKYTQIVEDGKIIGYDLYI